MDTKKKELVGLFKNGGRELRPKGAPEQVLVHDFLIPDLGRVSPYGVCTISPRTRPGSVWGRTTIRLLLPSRAIRPLVARHGAARGDPSATRLLITARPAGPSPRSKLGYRLRLVEASGRLQKLADETGPEIDVATSHRTGKWNQIEHRYVLAANQSELARESSLVSHEVVVNLLPGHHARTGPTPQRQLDTNRYPAGHTVSVHNSGQSICVDDSLNGEWNYSLLTPRIAEHVVKVKLFRDNS